MAPPWICSSWVGVAVPIPTLVLKLEAPVTARVDPILTAPFRVRAVVVVAPRPVTVARVEILLTVTEPTEAETLMSVPAARETTPALARETDPPRVTVPPPLIPVPGEMVILLLERAVVGILLCVLLLPDIVLL